MFEHFNKSPSQIAGKLDKIVIALTRNNSLDNNFFYLAPVVPSQYSDCYINLFHAKQESNGIDISIWWLCLYGLMFLSTRGYTKQNINII